MRGFTLIELLAVIVILAIILLIAIPTISNVIERVKIGAFKSSSELVVKASETAYLDRSLNSIDKEVVHTFDNYIQTTLPADVDDLEFSGTAPKEGVIIVYRDGQTEARISDGVFYTQTDYKGDFKDPVLYDPAKHDPLLNGTNDWIFEVTIPNGGAAFSFGAVDANLNVNWGDGTNTNHTYLGANYITHAYAEGTYNVAISGTSSHISFCNAIDYEATLTCTGTPQYLSDILTKIPVSLGLTSAKSMFAEVQLPGFSSLNFLAEASVNITELSYMFSETTNFNQYIRDWDTSNVTNMLGMFLNAYKYNQPSSNWDTSNVTNMNSLFSGAEKFNQSIDRWNTESVTDMRYMFYKASSYNQPLNNWNTSNVINMYGMFRSATLFNQPLNNWNTSNVVDMYQMFRDAVSFNQPLNNWNTSKVVTMYQTFTGATSFNQPLNNWDTSSATIMYEMFKGATSFNQPLDNWDISNVTTTWNMFQNATAFNQDISGWDTSSVIDMSGMFYGATIFNQDLSSWCVSLIPVEQSHFRTNTPAWLLPKPIWGTCP